MSDSSQIQVQTLFCLHREELHGFLHRRVGCEETARDLLQETFYRLLSAGLPEPLDNGRAYLYRIANRLLIDHLRRQQHRRHEPYHEETSPADGLTPQRWLEGDQDLQRLVRIIDELPPVRRRVFLLARVEQLSYREIGSRLGIAAKTVENHLAQAMRHCRQRLGECE